MENKYIRYVLGKDISIAELFSMLKQTDIVSLDTETTWGKATEVTLLTMQLAFKGNDKYYSIFIDCRNGVPGTVLKRLSQVTLICHNAKFDYTVLKQNLGFTHNDIEDTMIMSQLLTLGETKEPKKHSLASLVREYLDPYAYTNQGNLFDVVTTKNIRETFGTDEFTREQIVYALRDVEYTLALFYRLKDRLREEDLLDVYYKIEKDFVLVLADMEINGIHLNIDE